MTDTNSLQIKPKGCCIKTCFYREGPYMHVIATLISNGDVEVFKGSVDLRPISAAIARKHAELHGEDSVQVAGFFSSIAHAVNSIGHVKLIRGIANGIKDVAKSKAFGVVLGATAIVFPPVGAPALAAYAVAKTATGVIEEANAVKARAVQIAKNGTAAERAAVKANLPKIQTLLKQKASVQASLSRMADAAKKGDKEALTAQKIFGIVLKSHQGLKARATTPSVAKGVSAVMITRTGKVVPGHYVQQTANKKLAESVLFDGKGLLRGKYAAA